MYCLTTIKTIIGFVLWINEPLEFPWTCFHSDPLKLHFLIKLWSGSNSLEIPGHCLRMLGFKRKIFMRMCLANFIDLETNIMRGLMFYHTITSFACELVVTQNDVHLICFPEQQKFYHQILR